VIERVASNPNINLEIMDRLFAHHKEMVARDAEVAFNDAMSACQKEMPAVERDAENEQTHSWYTRLETLSDAAVPVYTKHGFSLSFDEEDSPKEGHIRVICYCSHKAGHTRKYRGDVPLDIAGIKGNVNKTPTHAFGSTKSYGRRYLTLDIFNIVMKGEDNDGNGASNPAAGKPVAPADYKDWQKHMRTTAEGGLKKLQEAWNKTAQELRDFATQHDVTWWEAVKKEAAKVKT
jgi:hypothetical protein